MNLKQALNHLHKERRAVAALLSNLDSAIAALSSGNTSSTVKPRRTLSAAARRKIAAAQRARWAKVRAAKKR